MSGILPVKSDNGKMNKPIIIAEAGVNHNGSVERALAMVDAAFAAGADYIKFQTFRAEKLVTARAAKAEYQKANDPGGDSQLEMLRALELSESEFRRIAAYCRGCGIGFMSTPFDIDSADFLHEIGQDYWKIPSGEITNLPLLRHIGAFRGKVILSTGMSTMDEVKAAVGVLAGAGTPKEYIMLLHCTTQYPAPYDSVNLLAMNTLREAGCGGVGYSDHTRGIEIPIAATALGAMVIEKHFTLDRNLPGPDHRASLEPSELRDMCEAIRNTALALGNAEKTVTDAERPNIAVARKSIVATRPIAAGETFSEENLGVKRPGSGLSPMLWDEVVGKPAPRAFDVDDSVTLE